MTGDLAGWNWQNVTDPEDTRVSFLLKDDRGCPGYGLGAALNDLGLPTKSSDDPNNGIQVIYVSHGDFSLLPTDPGYVSVNGQTYNVGATTYHITGGYYKFGIETSTGAIFGLDLLAPVKAATERKPPVPKEGLPALQRFSDVAWLFWAKQTARKNNVRYMFTIAIVNEETQKAIRRALKSTNATYGPWPGATFSTDSDEGKVLLGSPNGRAYGYFLSQHKRELGGNMYISKIQVFHGETKPLIPNMVLHVEQPKPTAKKRGSRKRKAKL
ncbi:hypothetical protein BU25DRAFT_157490 [Macroventuria anomochaeta]|uniref:Uncharacterized protein n=1 Tax=Macroventuria anomochaeta TaxID=301207 RepID=A0ACB6RT57_9PLEO|nr:uncharacterized protein BU25DRAFT_157490 [Macroventuria anomochaeta]KAF2624314.1 hypothetical protein BU25DRAFT_157490 [Macroventuria anomochaeta]